MESICIVGESFSFCLAFIFRDNFFLSQKHKLLHMKDMYLESVNIFLLQTKNGITTVEILLIVCTY